MLYILFIASAQWKLTSTWHNAPRPHQDWCGVVYLCGIVWELYCFLSNSTCTDFLVAFLPVLYTETDCPVILAVTCITTEIDLQQLCLGQAKKKNPWEEEPFFRLNYSKYQLIYLKSKKIRKKKERVANSLLHECPVFSCCFFWCFFIDQLPWYN